VKVLGLNVGYSQASSAAHSYDRHRLSDGSAAMIVDGRIEFAAIEERHSRDRYAGGFSAIAQAVQKRSREFIADVVAMSSCCGPRWQAGFAAQEEIAKAFLLSRTRDSKVAPPAIVIVGHHDSHASLGFVSSGAGRALVAVIDGFGNLIDETTWSPETWWRGRFERHTYYIAEWHGNVFSLVSIDSDATGIDSIGLGEAYRAITHFCGWDSYQQAGSAMALAAFGNAARYPNARFIDCDGEQIRIHLENDHPDPEGVIERRLRRLGISLEAIQGRQATPLDAEHCAIVAQMQRQFTEALCVRTLTLAKQYAVNEIVVSGGAALNCLALGELQRRFAGRVSVPPAPSDTGQGLGNALWATFCEASPLKTGKWDRPDLSQAPFWGVAYDESAIRDALNFFHDSAGFAVCQHTSAREQAELAASLLKQGLIVATALGRSEYGPRALGARSVLADARDPAMPEKLNAFKRREAFRPFAPAILAEFVDDYLQFPVSSPFMSFAVPLKLAARATVPSAAHADGTARVQTVAADTGSPLRPILESFYGITGVPVLLNTSFNRKGQPIVETPSDAVRSFAESSLDALLLDRVTVQRSTSK
jgi:carbamoyltransferase